MISDWPRVYSLDVIPKCGETWNVTQQSTTMMINCKSHVIQKEREREKEKEREMTFLFLILIAAFTTAVCEVGGEKECPPLFEWVNTSETGGYCACAVGALRFLYCDQINQRMWLSQGFYAFYDSEKYSVEAYECPFIFPKSATENGMFPLPANVSELNSVVCGNLSREVKGPACGRCTNGTGPSIYSVGSRCVHCSPVHIIYYLLLQYLPSTVIFLLVIIFRPNITSAPMASYVLFCNSVVLYFRFISWLFIKLDDFVGKLTLTLSALWSFDALLFFSPPICIIKNIEEVYIPFFDFLATIYPFILLLLTYGVIKLHTKNFRPVVCLWRLFGRVFVQCYRAWDPRSSMIQAFASIFFLSYAKLSYLIWEAFMSTEDMTGHARGKQILFTDPNVPYNSTKHILLMAFSVGVAVFVFLPPLVILIVYPTSLYRKISHRIQPKWRLRIKTYVETFHSSFKDGTNGTRDYRSLSGWGFLLIGFIPQLLLGITAISVQYWKVYIYISYPVAIFFGIAAILCALLQPYKEKASNGLTTSILVISSMLLATGPGIYDSQGSKLVRPMVIVLLLIPHCVLWGYVFWRVLKTIAACCRCVKKTNTERERPLHRSSDSIITSGTVGQSFDQLSTQVW